MCRIVSLENGSPEPTLRKEETDRGSIARFVPRITCIETFLLLLFVFRCSPPATDLTTTRSTDPSESDHQYKPPLPSTVSFPKSCNFHGQLDETPSLQHEKKYRFNLNCQLKFRIYPDFCGSILFVALFSLSVLTSYPVGL